MTEEIGQKKRGCNNPPQSEWEWAGLRGLGVEGEKRPGGVFAPPILPEARGL
jgi:hypothetical protein